MTEDFVTVRVVRLDGPDTREALEHALEGVSGAPSVIGPHRRGGWWVELTGGRPDWDEALVTLRDRGWAGAF